MRKSTILESLVRFCEAIETLYMRDYLRKPMPRDLQRLLQKVEAQGFSVMIGSIDYMHKEIMGIGRAKNYHSGSCCIIGMPFLELWDLKITSTCSVNLRCSTMC
ncbi:unnamed protein product [Prunus brigantina]